MIHCQIFMIQLQPDQINMAVFFWYLVKVTCPVYIVYTGRATFYKVPETHGRV